MVEVSTKRTKSQTRSLTLESRGASKGASPVRGGARGKGERKLHLACGLLYYSLSYRDLEEMMVERGLSVDHTTIYRWVQHYAPILEKKCRAKLKPTNNSWRVDETYIKVKGAWMYLYRAVDSTGATVEFMLSSTREVASELRTQIGAETSHRLSLQKPNHALEEHR